ncbi:hypothetical protein GCM10029976_067420 [Kribbella albertanoniae]|uniref:Uncharacterized protein n=1 Tax=Kribbella albertanoniae TaxID=1266829 RepID=A0A4R4QJG9_9ACTN|nr:hypothetical protein [Kribbella albertanoniae]TDC35844.1 hypothetical protein E1261_00530 [Kribbella albertanoniae]
MANYSISAAQLSEGEIVLIRGKLGFSRLTRLIDGAQLEASDARKVQSGGIAVGKPHTSATITHAEVICKDADNPTVEERYVAERRFASAKHPDTGANYSIDSKGSLPGIAVPGDGGKVVPDDSGRELAQGLDVTLVLRVFKPKGYANRGLSLDTVIVNEPVRYYVGNTNAAELAARGIVFAAPPQSVQAAAAPGSEQHGAVATVVDDGTGTVIDENGFALPGPSAHQPQQAAPATAAAPNSVPASQATAPAAQQEETLEAKLARLEAENSALKDAGSAIGTPFALTAPASPWSDDSPAGETAGITYQG